MAPVMHIAIKSDTSQPADKMGSSVPDRLGGTEGDIC